MQNGFQGISSFAVCIGYCVKQRFFLRRLQIFSAYVVSFRNSDAASVASDSFYRILPGELYDVVDNSSAADAKLKCKVLDVFRASFAQNI